MWIDDRGWLAGDDADAGDPAVKRFPTVRTSMLKVSQPLGIVWHWTGGKGGPKFAENLAKSIQGYQRGVDRAASWHVLIAKDGTIYQSAPFTVGTWHVGRPGMIAGKQFANVNRATIGCELENAGRLKEVGGRFYCWPYYSNPDSFNDHRPSSKYEIGAERAAQTEEGFFDRYTDSQGNSADVLLRALVKYYDWQRDQCAYGHIDFDYPRKEDPGPLWMKKVLPRCLVGLFGTV